jgi:hypothetical protein
MANYSWRILLSLFVTLVVVGCTSAAIAPEVFRNNVAKGLRLIETDPGVDPVWMTQDEKFAFMKKDRNFVSRLALFLSLQP